MLSQLHDFYDTMSEPNRSCLLALRALILDHHTAVSETMKYSMPCFVVNRKPICYLWTDKITAKPYVLFVEGGILDHPLLEKGNRKRMKTLPISPAHDLPMELLSMLLHQVISHALAHQKKHSK